MAEEITLLQNPIDAIYLIHKALRVEADRAEKVVNELEIGGSLQSFKLAFNSWVTALVFHSEQEDRYIIHPLTNSHRPGQIETKTPELSKGSKGLGIDVKAAIVAQEEELHRELLDGVQDVLDVLNEEIGKTSIIRRTKQHLHMQVISLRMAQQDHLETEEALVLPVIRERLSELEQLEVIKGLLTDDVAEDPRWVIEWVSQQLSPEEQKLLANFEARFNESSASNS